MAKSIDKACGICMEVVVEKVGPRLPSRDGVVGRKDGSGSAVSEKWFRDLSSGTNFLYTGGTKFSPDG